MAQAGQVNMANRRQTLDLELHSGPGSIFHAQQFHYYFYCLSNTIIIIEVPTANSSPPIGILNFGQQ